MNDTQSIYSYPLSYQSSDRLRLSQFPSSKKEILLKTPPRPIIEELVPVSDMSTFIPSNALIGNACLKDLKSNMDKYV